MGAIDTMVKSYRANLDLLNKHIPFKKQRERISIKNFQLKYKTLSENELLRFKEVNKRRRRLETFWLWLVFLIIFTSLAGLFYMQLF